MYEKIIHIYFIYKQNWIGISIAMTFRQNGLRPILAAQENLTVLMGMKQKKNNGRLKKKLNSAHSQYFFQGPIHTLVLGLVG